MSIQHTMGRTAKKKVVPSAPVASPNKWQDLDDVVSSADEAPVASVSPQATVEVKEVEVIKEVEVVKEVVKEVIKEVVKEVVKEYPGPSCLSPDRFKDTLSLMKDYRNRSLSEIMLDVDIDQSLKEDISMVYHELGWIDDYANVVYNAALSNFWDLARTLFDLMSPKEHWKLLRMLIGNWVSFRNRKALRDFCVNVVIKANPKAMTMLNDWAKEYGKTLGMVCKGYCDLCQGDNKKFAMEYSEL